MAEEDLRNTIENRETRETSLPIYILLCSNGGGYGVVVVVEMVTNSNHLTSNNN